MKKKLELNVPDFKLFDFHRHVSDIELFDKNLTEFNIDKFCLMPSMIENDFQDIPKYVEKLIPYYRKYTKRAVVQSTGKYVVSSTTSVR